MTIYSFSGEINIGRSKHGFKKEIKANSEKHAEEKLFSKLGSEHSITRNKIQIKSMEKQK